VSHFQFVSWDDTAYVTENRSVLAGLSWSNVAWAFTTDHGPYWHPLTWLSHMLDVQIYGTNASGHHVTNLLIHIANSILLFWLLRRLTGAEWRSAFVAALFAVHPLHVESVAWIAERKDVLSAFFWILTTITYVAYVRKPGRYRYAAVLSVFALGLMAKPMIVTLPLVLLLLDYWPLARVTTSRPWGSLVAEKLPMAALAAAAGVVTFVLQKRVGAVAGLRAVPLDARLANAAISTVQYLVKTIWPARLAALYPYPLSVPSLWLVLGAVFALVTITAAVCRQSRRRPYLVVGWLWFALTLLPVIGLVQVGEQAMADRFTYIPLIGIFIIVAWGVPEFMLAGRARRVLLPAAAAASIAVCVIVARAQASTWATSETMWRHAIAVTSDNAHAHTALGALLADEGHAAEAMTEKAEALRINPDDPDANNEMGVLLEQQGRHGEAIGTLSKALAENPAYAEAHHNLGVALVSEGHTPEAIAQFSEALRLDPELPKTENALGLTLAHEGRLDEALAHFSEAVRLNPEFAAAYYDLGVALATGGRVTDAIAAFRQTLDRDPQHAEAHVNLGMALASLGRGEEAIAEYQAALHINPDLAEAHSNLAAVLDAGGRIDDALRESLEAVRLAPSRADFQYNAAVIFYQKGNVREALRHLDTALELSPAYEPAKEMLESLTKRLSRED